MTDAASSPRSTPAPRAQAASDRVASDSAPSTAPRPNKRALAKAVTRARVLDAARFLFSNTGWFPSTIRGIAERAGMSTGAVFANFEDKEHLWREAMGGPAPDPRLSEEFALAAAACPGAPIWIYADGDRCRAGIGNPVRALAVHGEGGFHGTGDTPAEALRQARIQADRKRVGQGGPGAGDDPGNARLAAYAVTA